MSVLIGPNLSTIGWVILEKQENEITETDEDTYVAQTIHVVETSTVFANPASIAPLSTPIPSTHLLTFTDTEIFPARYVVCEENHSKPALPNTSLSLPLLPPAQHNIYPSLPCPTPHLHLRIPAEQKIAPITSSKKSPRAVNKHLVLVLSAAAHATGFCLSTRFGWSILGTTCVIALLVGLSTKHFRPSGSYSKAS